MNRRGFLGSLAVALVAPFLPTPKPALALHPDAFRMVMSSLDLDAVRLRYIEPAVRALMDRHDDRLLAAFYGSREPLGVRILNA